MRKFVVLAVAVLACVPCIEWTRLKGTVKAINLKSSTLTIQNDEGDLLTIPVDYQVRIIEKKNAVKQLRDIDLDAKVTLIRTPSEQPKDDNEGLVPYKGGN